MKKIPLIRPYITQEVKQAVCDVLESGHLTEGPMTQALEQAFRDYIGCGYAIAVTSCTTGLETALRAIGISPGDEVIVPDYTYPATACAVRIVGATVVIVDVDPETMLIDYDAIEGAITDRTKAVIPVSIFGNPLDYDRLNRIKERFGIIILEDAACSIGARYRGVCVGNLADISVFSLHPRKFITTGEGGIITTNNKAWAEWIQSYKHFGMGKADSRLKAQFKRIGTNYKLSDIQAAVGLVQMRHIEALLETRIRLSERYHEFLEGSPGISISRVTAGGRHSRQSFCVFVGNRDGVMTRLREQNIEVQIGTYSLSRQAAFSPSSVCRIVGDMAGSLWAFDHCLTLPLFEGLAAEDQQFVVARLLEAMEAV
ncbi:MAG: DegT/DnrJ/EryC1/StrS aminotransferase family protein [Deltaproteobacteria bacterium]|nr:DegT/DnrJ/EryC1/StrS aminotransferase family protein [Deltaproteobacteria bacterium]